MKDKAKQNSVCVFSFRLTKAEREQLQQLADLHERKLGDLLRLIVRKEIKKMLAGHKPPTPGELSD